MDRPIIWTQEQLRSFDAVSWETDALIALARLTQDFLGGTTTVVHGLTATPSSPASLVLNLTGGAIYQLADVDATAIGKIPQNLAQVMQQGYAAAQTVTLSTSGIAGGQSRYTLIQAQFNQIDAVAPNDPNGGVPPFYNAANPASPIYTSVDTDRTGVCTVGLVTGAAATTGTEVPPTPTAGWVPLYLIDLAYGQTAVTSGQILVAGPSVGTNVPSNYPGAPFLAGLLNSHHGGTPGQAPKINLGTETTGTLPGQLLNVQKFSSHGTYTYTPTPGTTAIIVEVIGAGGGGGGAPTPTGGANYVSVSGGGGSGAPAKSYITTGFSGVTVTVGQGGLGGNGATGGGTSYVGGNGGTSSFGSAVSAPGGYGGTAAANVYGNASLGYGQGASVASGGNISNGAGTGSTPGFVLSSGGGFSGPGGNSIYGGGGTPVINTTGNGGAGLSPGSGGGGALSCYNFSPANVNGGTGADGQVIIWEY